MNRVSLESSKAGALAHSCIYDGKVRHRRFTPVSNAFRYTMFMWYIDLDELDALIDKFWFLRKEKKGIVSFFRSDYFGDADKDLKTEVIHRVSDFYSGSGQSIPEIKSVRMLTHLRYFNIIFNPVTFYYCFDADNDLVAILAEITNTPWGERHAYVLPFDRAERLTDASSGDSIVARERARGVKTYEFDKAFHVSPFNPMNMVYHWTFKAPEDVLSVHMDNTMEEGLDKTPVKHFDATLGLKSRPIERAPRILLKQPVMTLKVVVGIYWQALKLFIKRSPFYDHPNVAKERMAAKEKPTQNTCIEERA